jgi:hypothetical protein
MYLRFQYPKSSLLGGGSVQIMSHHEVPFIQYPEILILPFTDFIGVLVIDAF